MKYKLLTDYCGQLEGTIVYRCKESDYGCASDDTRITGVRHYAMTLDEDGNYPFFTVPDVLMVMVK